MISSVFAAATAILAQAAVAASPSASSSTFDTVAEGVAEISTSVCYRLTTGELRWTARNLSEEMAQVEAQRLTYGVPSAVTDALGPVGHASINRATMASRNYGNYQAILAVNGTIPGCRVMLAGDSHPAMADLVATALVKAGWKARPALTTKRDEYERRLFVRADGEQFYRLDAAFRSDRFAGVRLLVAVSSATEPNSPPRGTLPSTRTQQAPRSRPDVEIVAHAYDRCMVMYAVRLSKTATKDDEIYARATELCLPLKSKVTAALTAQQPEQATETLKAIDAQAKPNFMTMLAKIRSNRAKRSGD